MKSILTSLAITLTLLMLIVSAPAQTAKVIELSPADAAEVKAAYAARDAAIKRITDLERKIGDKYLSEVKPGSGWVLITQPPLTESLCFDSQSGVSSCGGTPETLAEKKKREDAANKFEAEEAKKTHLERKRGWESFEYSEDFKFIVPITVMYHPSNGCGAFGVLTAN